MSDIDGTTSGERVRPSLADAAALLQGLRNARIGVWRWFVDEGRLEWTENLPALHGIAPDAFDGTIDSFARDVHDDDAVAVWTAIRRTVETGEPFHVIYRSARAPAETPVWLDSRGGFLLDDDGRRVLTGVCSDATERVVARNELERRLRQQKAVAALGSYALETGDFAAILDRAVRSAAEVLDAPLAKILQLADSADHLLLRAGVGWRPGLVGVATVGVERESQAGYTLASSEPVIVADLATEMRFNGPAILTEHGAVSGLSVIIAGSDVRPFGVFGVHTTTRRAFDAADAEFLLALSNIVASASRQAAAAGHKEMLVREMAHRAGNMLQFVSSIASQTFRDEVDQGQARRAFSERLSSLARANYLIAKGGWTQTRLMALTEEVLRPFLDRLEPRGLDVLLSPDLSFDLGLILQELAMNSARYGAFAQVDGRVRLEWSIDAGERPEARVLTVRWCDAPARAPEAPAARLRKPGFGSQLIAALVERKWHGRLSIATEPHYHLSFSIPLR